MALCHRCKRRIRQTAELSPRPQEAAATTTENTATSSASSPRCSRDATTTLGVASANVDGGEHGRGDDDLALEGHLIPLMMARNGAECRGLGILALELTGLYISRAPR